MNAISSCGILPLYERPGDFVRGRADEVLYGTRVLILRDGAESAGDNTEDTEDVAEPAGNGAERPGNGAEPAGNGAEHPGNGAERTGNGAERPGNGAERTGNESGWVKVRTSYRYEGWVRKSGLQYDSACQKASSTLHKCLVTSCFCDVLAAPRVAAELFLSVPCGSVLRTSYPLEKKFRQTADSPQWVKVILADGREGYTAASHLGPVPEATGNEEKFREEVVRAAKTFLGVPYRWGGRTHLGIDCSGLAFMSYFLNGVSIYRDAQIKPGFPIHEIPRENVKAGDLYFFPGHVAVALGGGDFIHSTGRAGDDGVVFGSLAPDHGFYRADLAATLTACGSIF